MRRRWFVLAFGAAGVALLGAALMAACSSSSTGSTVPKDPSSVGKSTGGTTGGPSPTAPGPASKYAPSLKDLSGLYTVDVPDTFTQNISTFASSYLFPNNQQGEQLASQWKIIDGYKVSYQPDGLAAGEVKGNYYVTAEVYLFQDTAGAADAYTYMADFFSNGPAAEKDDAKGLGNSSAGLPRRPGHRRPDRYARRSSTASSSGGGMSSRWSARRARRASSPSTGRAMSPSSSTTASWATATPRRQRQSRRRRFRCHRQRPLRRSRRLERMSRAG